MSGAHRSESGPRPRTQAPDTQRTIDARQAAAVTAAFVFLMDTAHLSAHARVECRHSAATDTQEFVIQRDPSEPEHIIRLGSVRDVNSTSTPPFDEPTKLFVDVTKEEIRISGINYSVEDPEAFKMYLIPLINNAKRELNLSWSSMDEMSPRDLISTASWIASKKLSYDSRLAEVIYGKKNPQYNKVLAKHVEDQPLDIKIMKGGIGVCSDYASEVTFLSKTIKEIVKSEACKFVHVADLESRYDIHALNVIFELKNESGKPAMLFYYVDVSALEQGGPFSVNVLDALRFPIQKIGQTGRAYLAPTLSDNDARTLLKCLVDHREQGVLNLSVINGIAHSYWNSLRELQRNGDYRAAEELAREEREYYRRMLPNLLSEIESGKHQGDYLKNYPYQKLFTYQLLEWFYQRLEENEQRLSVLEKLHLISEWDDAKFKLSFGDTYADQLGTTGNVQRALEVYEELFAGFQKTESEQKVVFKKMIHERGEIVELEPFASREQFERYVSYKKQEWESGMRR